MHNAANHALSFSLAVLPLIYLSSCQSGPVPFPEEVEARLPEAVDFNYHIKPILSDRCFACHGPDENARKAELRLDIEEDALQAIGDERDHYALVPGDPHASSLFTRITSDDPDMVMPPPESNLTLSEEEVALLTRWIEQGAAYKPHWSFIPPERPEVPVADEPQRATNPIDHFVQESLKKQDLSPTSEAEKETLIRRLTFDLTGLPPTLDDIKTFVADDSPDAYEKVVDRLLASPHYGEQMAARWMEIARYSDTHGYQDDQYRYMWPWRDWVIDAFNRNMPYDQFVTWQLAGDLLPNATREQILATGFNRNHVQNVEGGIVEEEFRVEYVADRANTLGKAFLGLSTECARCHDHKYDPISQKEYYQLFAFFNNNDEVGRIPRDGGEAPGPALLLTDEDTEQQLAFLQEKIQEQENQLRQISQESDASFSSWLKKGGARAVLNSEIPNTIAHFAMGKSSHEQLKDIEEIDGKVGKATYFDGGSGAKLEVPSFERSDPFSLGFWLKSPAVEDYAGVLAFSNGYYGGYKGYEVLVTEARLEFRLSHEFPYNAIQLFSQEKAPVDEWLHVAITYDGSSEARGIHLYFNGQPAAVDVQRDNLYQSVIPDVIQFGDNRYLRLGTRDNEKGFTHGALDEVMVFDRALTPLEVNKLSGQQEAVASLVQQAAFDPKDQEALRRYYLSVVDGAYRRGLSALKDLRKQENTLLTNTPEMMVMGERTEPRPTYLLERGAYDAHGEEVTPGTLTQVLEFSEDLPRNRLGLAQWLVSPENPLTARVTVNRLWHQFFGEGIVNTLDDFGNQGALPTHPELLDWLAMEFVASGWDIKALQKLMLLSATYRQSSVAPEAVRQQDPSNRWLARGPSRRLPAELIRNNALAASGVLVSKVGGPSVKPYQPQGLWKEKASVVGEREYKAGKGDELYRRSLYTYWRRTIPPPSMLIFDANERNVCTVKRQTTSTPLQALVLLNDPQYVEASRLLAERMLTEGGETLADQLAYGFRLLIGRAPLDKERSILQQLYQEEEERFRQDTKSAAELLAVGAHRRNTTLDVPQLAAMAVVTNIMMNHDEAYTQR